VDSRERGKSGLPDGVSLDVAQPNPVGLECRVPQIMFVDEPLSQVLAKSLSTRGAELALVPKCQELVELFPRFLLGVGESFRTFSIYLDLRNVFVLVRIEEDCASAFAVPNTSRSIAVGCHDLPPASNCAT
jgi:hypothetical protein